jgi:hypothetical protein
VPAAQPYTARPDEGLGALVTSSPQVPAANPYTTRPDEGLGALVTSP